MQEISDVNSLLFHSSLDSAVGRFGIERDFYQMSCVQYNFAAIMQILRFKVD
jgi:carbohydrate-selective porin OprB